MDSAAEEDEEESFQGSSGENIPSATQVSNHRLHPHHLPARPAMKRHFSESNLGFAASSMPGAGGSLTRDPSVYDTVFIHQHEHSHHGHSHMHSHIHSKPDSISSVGKKKKLFFS